MDETTKELLLKLFKEQECGECTLNDFCKANNETVCSILANKYSNGFNRK